MEQKDYKLEIIIALLQERGHVRGIANRLGTNHMIISRKIKELSKENVLDFVQEGKNKTYFLKKTAEARALIFMAENYKILQAIEKYPRLRRIIEKIQKDKQIHLALLFGSYAKGTASKDSDVDIYIETKDENLKKQLKMFDSKLSIKIGDYESQSLLIKEIEDNHITIKGIEYFYEKNKFFD
jgi:predicted nucleotidyltransferase